MTPSKTSIERNPTEPIIKMFNQEKRDFNNFKIEDTKKDRERISTTIKINQVKTKTKEEGIEIKIKNITPRIGIIAVAIIIILG